MTKALVVISGASRGFGQVLAQVALERLKREGYQSVQMVLLARTMEGLQQTEHLLFEHGIGLNIMCCLEHVDFASISDYEMSSLSEQWKNKWIQFQAQRQDSALIHNFMVINNAASLGDVTKTCLDWRSDGDLSTYFRVNLTAPIILTQTILSRFRDLVDGCISIVNISSLLAMKSVPYAGLYCTGKAARNMWFKVMAKEEAQRHEGAIKLCQVNSSDGVQTTPSKQLDLKVLSYSPGPMDTEMARELANSSGDSETRSFFTDLWENHASVSLWDSANKLFSLLLDERQLWQTGEHISFVVEKVD